MARPVFEVVEVHDFIQSAGDRFQIAARQPPIRGKPFAYDQQVLQMAGQGRIVVGYKPSDIDEGVLFGAHGSAVGV